jgi:hypothetical protein
MENLHHNYIYLIREREFIVHGNTPIYKIGKTTQNINKRLSCYPKNSELLLAIQVNDAHMAEKELLKEFQQRFIHRKDIGNEYFEGNENEMMKLIFTHKREFLSTTPTPTTSTIVKLTNYLYSFFHRLIKK